jgi:hypothetical protein
MSNKKSKLAQDEKDKIIRIITEKEEELKLMNSEELSKFIRNLILEAVIDGMSIKISNLDWSGCESASFEIKER